MQFVQPSRTRHGARKRLEIE